MTTSMSQASPRDALTSVILPAYNPGRAIERTWQSVQEFLGKQTRSWEVIFVCDGCTDGTSERLQQLISTSQWGVRVIGYAKNRGKGHAVRQGMSAARGRFRIFTDVDLAYEFGEIERVAQALWAGAEVAIASRDHPQSEVIIAPRLAGYLFRRQLQSRLFGALARWLLPIRQLDTQAGLKGMSAAVVERLVPRLDCDGFGFDCELLTACARLGIRVEEVPVRVAYRDMESTTGVRGIRRMISELFRIRRTWKKEIPAPRALKEMIWELPMKSSTSTPYRDESTKAA